LILAQISTLLLYALDLELHIRAWRQLNDQVTQDTDDPQSDQHIANAAKNIIDHSYSSILFPLQRCPSNACFINFLKLGKGEKRLAIHNS
jgi:hypothetical protein